MNRVKAWTPGDGRAIGSKAERPGHVADARLRRFRGDADCIKGAERRGPKSRHWQTVLQLMSDEPLSVEPGDSVSFEFEARPESAVTKATWGAGTGGVLSGPVVTPRRLASASAVAGG